MKHKLMLPFFWLMAFSCLAHGEESKGSLAKTQDDQKPSSGTKFPFCIGYSDKNFIAFFDRLKKAIRENDKKTIAEKLIYYPFGWGQENAPCIIIYKPKEFIEQYDNIMTPLIKDFILQLEYKRERCCYWDQGDYWTLGYGTLHFNEKGIMYLNPPLENYHNLDSYKSTPPNPIAP